MQEFKYDTHVHTSQASKCAVLSGAKQAELYAKLGYTGIIITDHFFNGNSAIAEKLPWESKVELFCKGYEDAKEAGNNLGLSVFFGWEAFFYGTEFLIYGLDKKWLMEHPEVMKWTIKEQYENVKRDGGFIVHAHPFREAAYIEKIRLYPEYVDAVEAINCANHYRNPKFNTKALEYAAKYSLPITEGSDAHSKNCMHGGMIFEHELQDIQDFIDTISSKEGYSLIKMPTE